MRACPRNSANPSARAAEQGSALVVALLIIIMISMIGAALVAANTRARDSNRTRSDRVQGVGPTDAAIATYRFALQAGKATDLTDWFITRDDLREIIGGAGTTIPNAQAGPYGVVDTGAVGGVPATMRFTVMLGSGGQREFWQIYRLQAPDLGRDRDLRVWFRAWVGRWDQATNTVQSASAPRTIVASFRQGRFSDFQMLVNGPIKFDTGGMIFGPVHSNGYLDGVTQPPAGNPNARVFADPGSTITCPPSGAPVTTGAGTVALPAACRLVGDGQPTGRFVSFQGLTATFQEMRARCTTGRVRCVDGNRDDHTLRLLGNSVQVNGVTQPKPAEGIIFDGTVRVSGTINGRLSIGATSRTRTGAAPAMIIITGDVGTPTNADGTSRTRGEALGLFAQGDIVVDPTPATCAGLIHGVLISGSGALTIGRERRTSQPPTVGVVAPCPRRLVLSGAVATNSAPQLSWRWPERNLAIGYSERQYVWDTALRDAPPPFVPVTGTWENGTWKEADLACLSGARSSDPDCS